MSKKKAAGPAVSSPARQAAAPMTPPSEQSAVTLGPRDFVIGRLYIEGDLRITGTVEGEVQVTGDVEIDDVATVKASVVGRQVSIRGTVKGPVTARKRLVVSRSGSLIGDVRVPRLVVQEGATFSGNVSMSAPGEAAPKPPAAATAPLPAAVSKAPETVAPKAKELPRSTGNGKGRPTAPRGRAKAKRA